MEEVTIKLDVKNVEELLRHLTKIVEALESVREEIEQMVKFIETNLEVKHNVKSS